MLFSSLCGLLLGGMSWQALAHESRGDALEVRILQNGFSPKFKRAVIPKDTYESSRSQIRRQAQSDKQCGPKFGSCAAGECCSAEGYCGSTPEYCAAPDCLFEYGPACDTLAVPAGKSTASVPRSKPGSIPYGGDGIYTCSVPGTVALTFDDGPYSFTDHVLDLLKRYNAKATLFITGNNLGKGQIDDPRYPWANLIKRAFAEGHQIASHTWGHQDLSKITREQRRQQIISNEMALRNVLGFFPTYMRPPYSSCDAACATDLEALGYHITYFNLDTEDYLNTEPAQVQKPRDNFRGNLTSKSPATDDWLVISHDIHNQTANSLTEYMLQQVQDAGYRAVTVGECLDDPPANWYRAADGVRRAPSLFPSPNRPT